MGKNLGEIHGWLDDLAHGKRLQNYEIICPSSYSYIGLEKNATLQDKEGIAELKKRWGADPIHLTPVGYGKLAEAIIAEDSKEKDVKSNKLKKQEPTQEQRRDGLSRSDLTASRWGQEVWSNSLNRTRGRDEDASGSGRSRRIRGRARKRPKHF